MHRFPTTLHGRHGTLSGSPTVGRTPPRRRGGLVPQLFCAVVHNSRSPSSLAATTSEVPAVEESRCPPRFYGTIIHVFFLVPAHVIFGWYRYSWTFSRTSRAASSERPTSRSVALGRLRPIILRPVSGIVVLGKGLNVDYGTLMSSPEVAVQPHTGSVRGVGVALHWLLVKPRQTHEC